jgi:hypothetical protein
MAPGVDASCSVNILSGTSPVAYAVTRSPTGVLPGTLCLLTPATPEGLSVTYGVPTIDPITPTTIAFDQ